MIWGTRPCRPFGRDPRPMLNVYVLARHQRASAGNLLRSFPRLRFPMPPPAPSDFYHYSVLSLSPRAVRDGTQISNASAELKHLLSVHLASKWPTRGATRESRGLAPINRHGARDG